MGVIVCYSLPEIFTVCNGDGGRLWLMLCWRVGLGAGGGGVETLCHGMCCPLARKYRWEQKEVLLISTSIEKA